MRTPHCPQPAKTEDAIRTSLARRSLIAVTTIAMVAVVGPDVFNDGGTFTVDGTPVPVG